MMNTHYIKWVWICIFIAMMSCQVEHAVAQSTGNVQPKDNPFESVLKKQQYASTQGSQTLDEYNTELPELSVATIKLQYVDAKTASEAFSCLSSEIGNIVPRESGNSLIIFDTPKNLEKIVAEIKKADRPIESLTLQYVSMTYMDVNSVRGALSPMVSSGGSIISVEKTNGMILCDTQLNVEAMVKEIKKLDHPMEGLQVLPITFQDIAAASAKEALTNMLSSYGTISIVERTNSIVVCDLPRILDEISTEAKALDGETPGLVVEAINLKFLDAKNMETVLMKMLTQYGTVVGNQTTNTVIICDTKDNVARIVSEIRKVDDTPSQIMVDAVLLDVRMDDDKDIGIEWEAFSSDYRRRQNDIADFDGTVPWDSESNVGAAAGFDAVTGGWGHVVSGTVSALVTAIQTTRDVEILANPRALVLSGKTSTILAVEQVPYNVLNETSQGGSMTSTSFEEVGVTLEVTAILAENEEIVLTVDVEQSVRTGESLDGVPVIDTRKQNTSLLLKDGQVVIMGGLRRREKTSQVTKIPLLGDLPLLGNLFRSQHDIVLNSELVVLLSPHIHRGEAVPDGVRKKFDELRENAPLTGAVSKQ
jgi:type II secretory pathway component GspD/PulD (secretin)